MKKNYMKPEWEIVIVDMQCSLLAGSNLIIDDLTNNAVGRDEALAPELDNLLIIE